MHSFHNRLRAGSAHELRVAAELERRGWVVDLFGQGALKPEIRHVLNRIDTRLRNLPDMIAARGMELVVIDAKDRMSSTESRRYAISRKCVSAGLQWLGAYGIPIYYVFGNLGVLTPTEVMSYGHLGPRGMGGSYYLINERLAHPFDAVFGSSSEDERAA
jgi:hypothetical protein